MIFSTDRSRLRSEYHGSFFESNHSLMMNTMQMILETIVQGYACIEIIPGTSLIWSNVVSMFIECGNVMSIVSSSLGSLAHRMLSIVTKNILLTAGTVCKTTQNSADTSLTTNITNTDVGVLAPLPLCFLPSYVPHSSPFFSRHWQIPLHTQQFWSWSCKEPYPLSSICKLGDLITSIQVHVGNLAGLRKEGRNQGE